MSSSEREETATVQHANDVAEMDQATTSDVIGSPAAEATAMAVDPANLAAAAAEEEAAASRKRRPDRHEVTEIGAAAEEEKSDETDHTQLRRSRKRRALTSSSTAVNPAASSTEDDPFAFDAATATPAAAPAEKRKVGASLRARLEQQKRAQQEAESKTRQQTASQSTTPQTFLMHSAGYSALLDTQAIHCHRMRYFSSLLRTFRAGSWPSLHIVSPRFATRRELESHHSKEYLDFIERIVKKYVRVHDSAESASHAVGHIEEVEGGLTEEEESLRRKFGLLDDCPIFPEMWQLIRATVGGTLRALECLEQAHSLHPHAALTALHWGGGRHHGCSASAAGFCYCNDIVTGLLHLLSSDRYERILYVDLDIHHGDAVEEAFLTSRRVVTLSIHHRAPGFYPGTGGVDTGSDRSVRKQLRERIFLHTVC
jgi:acetoin utilization deacetylase AcuC-like enzyme